MIPDDQPEDPRTHPFYKLNDKDRRQFVWGAACSLCKAQPNKPCISYGLIAAGQPYCDFGNDGKPRLLQFHTERWKTAIRSFFGHADSVVLYAMILEFESHPDDYDTSQIPNPWTLRWGW